MAIVLDNITYTYGVGTPFEKTALHGVSLTVENGEFLGIIGHTGSGKSTFVQHLNGLLHPTTGTVTVNGVDISASTEEAKKMRHLQALTHLVVKKSLKRSFDFIKKRALL